MAKERDYAREYARDKSHGTLEKKQIISIGMSKEKAMMFDAKLSLEPLTDDGKRVTRNGLINKWIDMYLAGELD